MSGKNNITPEWLDQSISGVKINMTTSVKGKNTGKKDADGNHIPEFEPVKVELELDYTGMSLREIFTKAARADVITWANKNRPLGEEVVGDKKNWKVLVKDYFAQITRRPSKSVEQQIDDMNLEELAILEEKLKAKIKAAKAA